LASSRGDHHCLVNGVDRCRWRRYRWTTSYEIKVTFGDVSDDQKKWPELIKRRQNAIENENRIAMWTQTNLSDFNAVSNCLTV